MKAERGAGANWARWVVAVVAAVAVAVLGGCDAVYQGAIPDAAGSGTATSIPNVVVAARLPRALPVPASPGRRGNTGLSPSSAGRGGAASSAFCQDLKDELAAVPKVLSHVANPSQLSADLQATRQANAKIVRDAPAAIRADAQALVGISNRILDDATANPPNLQDITAAVSDPTYMSAATNVSRYAQVNCK